MAKGNDRTLFRIRLADNTLYASGDHDQQGRERGKRRWTNGRTVWATFAAAKRAFLAMPERMKPGAEIVEYELVEVNRYEVTDERQSLI